jgi:hypothetical protein
MKARLVLISILDFRNKWNCHVVTRQTEIPAANDQTRKPEMPLGKVAAKLMPV